MAIETENDQVSMAAEDYEQLRSKAKVVGLLAFIAGGILGYSYHEWTTSPTKWMVRGRRR